MTNRNGQKPQNLQLLAKDLFDFSDAKTINEDLWRIFVAAMDSSMIDSWSDRTRSNAVVTFKKVLCFINDAEKTID